MVTKKRDRKKEQPRVREKKSGACVNKDCKLRKKGCRGFEGCPGYKSA